MVARMRNPEPPSIKPVEIGKLFMKKTEFKKILKECVKEIIQEAVNHLGETAYRNYNSWKRACKQASPNCKFDGDRDVCNCFSQDGKPIGEWDGETGSVHTQIKEDSPCWDGYEQIGMKNKGGKEVPNCVPKK
jgi:hypothetical protein